MHGVSCYISVITNINSTPSEEDIGTSQCSLSAKNGHASSASFSRIRHGIMSRSTTTPETLYIADNQSLRKINTSNNNYIVSNISNTDLHEIQSFKIFYKLRIW